MEAGKEQLAAERMRPETSMEATVQAVQLGMEIGPRHLSEAAVEDHDAVLGIAAHRTAFGRKKAEHSTGGPSQ